MNLTETMGISLVKQVMNIQMRLMKYGNGHRVLHDLADHKTAHATVSG